MRKLKTLLAIFLTMLKIGAFTFGGGYAMLALLEDEFVTRRAWLGKDEFLDLAAIAESTPGPIAINAATYIGYKRAGVLGSVVSTLGICIPSFTIIYIISLFFDKFLSFTLVEYAFRGVQVCVIYLILSAGVKMLKGIKKTPFNLIVITLSFSVLSVITLFSLRFSVVFIILGAGVVGTSAYLIGQVRGGKKNDIS